jgi:hypothetical protein
VPGVATIVFNNVTSISEFAIASFGAKGLRLHKTPRTRSRSSRSIAVTLKKKRTDQSYISKNSEKL